LVVVGLPLTDAFAFLQYPERDGDEPRAKLDAQPDNELGIELRAKLISIALWILKECERIRKKQSDNYQGIIDVTTIIRDGLR